jgi:hypothetical protein
MGTEEGDEVMALSGAPRGHATNERAAIEPSNCKSRLSFQLQDFRNQWEGQVACRADTAIRRRAVWPRWRTESPLLLCSYSPRISPRSAMRVRNASEERCRLPACASERDREEPEDPSDQTSEEHPIHPPSCFGGLRPPNRGSPNPTDNDNAGIVPCRCYLPDLLMSLLYFGLWRRVQR